MPFPESTVLERKCDTIIVKLLKEAGFQDIRSAEKRRFSPYDFRGFKDGKLCFIEARVRNPEAKTQFFTFRHTKIKHLAQLEKKGDVYVILLNKYGHRILTLEELLSGEHKDIIFFRFKGQKAYYWRKDGWRKSESGVKKRHVSISMDKDFLAELDEAIKKYSLPNRSALIQQWSRMGLKNLKKELGIPLKRKWEIAPEI